MFSRALLPGAEMIKGTKLNERWSRQRKLLGWVEPLQWQWGGLLQKGSLKHGVHHGHGCPHRCQSHQCPLGQEVAASQVFQALLMRWSEPVSKASPLQQRRYLGLLPSKDANAAFEHPWGSG